MAQQNQIQQQPRPELRPQMFEPNDIYEAKKLSLPDYDDPSFSPSNFRSGGDGPKHDERWEKETDFIVDKILCESFRVRTPGCWTTAAEPDVLPKSCVIKSSIFSVWISLRVCANTRLSM